MPFIICVKTIYKNVKTFTNDYESDKWITKLSIFPMEIVFVVKK